MSILYKYYCSKCPLLNKCKNLTDKNNGILREYSHKINSLMRLCNDNSCILFYGECRGCETVVTVMVNKPLLSLSKIDMTFRAYNMGHRIVRTMLLELELYINEDNSYNCKIVEINGVQNEGYGSLIMEQALLFLNSYNINYIYGRISFVDYDHIELLHHFYKKFGFTIDGDNIRLDLER